MMATSPRKESSNLIKAKELLRIQKPDAKVLYELSQELINEGNFRYARLILSRYAESDEATKDPKQRIKVIQKLALATYKDVDQPLARRLEDALVILSGESLESTSNSESLSLAGAIFKRKWEHDGRRENLIQAIEYYKRASEKALMHSENSEIDYGYPAVNAAFLLDRMAALQASARDTSGSSPKALQDEARKIRETVVKLLKPIVEAGSENWWATVTVVEALFGLGLYRESADFCNAYAPADIAAWQRESTAQQLGRLAELQAGGPGHTLPKELGEALRAILGKNVPAFLSGPRGKVGLALSGGGFRASFFHIGVLARLAEQDLLRHVEVLSCVSGGSIVGAQYYLEARHLLQSKRDEDIRREDYVNIVQDLQDNFLKGVQKNIRMRLALNPLKNLQMIFCRGYTRTHYLGELYETHLYNSVKDGEKHERWLNNLYIHPKEDEPEGGFHPRKHNWRRFSKVPDIVLNATALNTGHTWQFTASYMGESPESIDRDVDANERLRRMYYDEAPENYQRVRLGHAVAASSCVPGLFEPLSMPGLYPDRTVRLVDGGVYDNQGVEALLQHDCTSIIVSDASGQMGVERRPASGALGVALRANSILQARIREAEYHDVKKRHEAGLLRTFVFVHLKKGLDQESVPWITCQDIDEDDSKNFRERPLTDYALRKDVQRLLSGIRTDLDSFHDKEAMALMTSGYRMIEHELHNQEISGTNPIVSREHWRFLDIESSMKDLRDPGYTELVRVLAASSKLAFKVWTLSLPLKLVSWFLGVVALALAGSACWKWWSAPLLTVQGAVLGAGGIVAGALGVPWLFRLARLRNLIVRSAMGAGIAILGWLVVTIHLVLFDTLYLRIGKLPKLVAVPNIGKGGPSNPAQGQTTEPVPAPAKPPPH